MCIFIQGNIYPLSGIRSDISLDTHRAAAAYQPEAGNAISEPETLSSGDLDLTQATFELHSEHQPHMSFANPLYSPVRTIYFLSNNYLLPVLLFFLTLDYKILLLS